MSKNNPIKNNIVKLDDANKAILNGRILEKGDLIIKYGLYATILLLSIFLFIALILVLLGSLSLSIDIAIELIFAIIFILYALYYATAGSGKGLVFIGKRWIALPDTFSHIDSNGLADKYSLLKANDIDLLYNSKKWELHSDKNHIHITEETAQAICKYVFSNEEMFQQLKSKPNVRYTRIILSNE